MPSDVAPIVDIPRIALRYQRRVAAACPAHLPLAMRVLDRLEPRRWTIEWYLPLWLGDAYGLDIEIAEELVLSNVLGLASIRLRDDLADGEVPADDVAAAQTLGDALFRLALAPYRAMFPASSPFWGQLEACMSAWRAATTDTAPPDVAGRDHTGELAADQLAARGAPLKISAFAACLLTRKLDRYSVLGQCLDAALTALVLYDDIGDWRTDLDAGRWNSFVAAASGLPQLPEFRARNRSSVLVAMMTSDAVDRQFARISRESALAAGLAADLGIGPLAVHLRDWDASARAQGTALRDHFHGLAERATDQILNASISAESAIRPVVALSSGRG